MNAIGVSAGIACAVILIWIGYIAGRRRVAVPPVDSTVLNEDERQRIVGLLQGLSRWTLEYSGNVSHYQNELGQLSRATLDNPRMSLMLGEIMSFNQQLKTRLEAAEKQLARQTESIESYLTEARTDGLTGLFNRRAFDKKLDELFLVYRAGGSSFVLILIDIDHFKRVNDEHGHPIGDVVLQRVAGILSGGFQSAEMVARFGGEEFAILARASLRSTAAQANEIRKRVAKEVVSMGSNRVSVTLSIGLSEPRGDLAVGTLVRRTDEALYTAKKTGRDRVYSDDGSGPRLFGAPEVAKA